MGCGGKFLTALLLTLVIVSTADSSSEDATPGLPFTFGNLQRINLKRTRFRSVVRQRPTPFLEQDLRVPGAYLYNGAGGPAPGFLVQYNTSTDSVHVLAGGFGPAVHHQSMPDFNQEWSPEEVRFDTLSMVTQINESHILFPEYRRGCVRVFDRDQNVVRPFIGQCSNSPYSLSPQTTSYSPDFANYTILKPFSITFAPKSKKLYIVDSDLGGNLHQIDLVTRSARNLGKFSDSAAYSISLDSSESIGFLRTAYSIIKTNLTEAVQSVSDHEAGTLNVETVAGENFFTGVELRRGGGNFSQPLFRAINDMKWLKQDEVLIATDVKSLKIIDLRQETVASICRSAADSSTWIQNGDDLSVCATFNPDLLVVEDNGQILISDQIDISPHSVLLKNMLNAFYRFSYNELFCDNSYLKSLNDRTILATPHGRDQQVSATHTYSCIDGYAAPYTTIRCRAEGQQLMWKPAPPKCMAIPEKKQSIGV